MRITIRFILCAAFVALASAPAAAQTFSVPSVEIGETELVDINTGEKVWLKDGSYNNRYIHRRASEGMVLITVKLHVLNTAQTGAATIETAAVRLTDPFDPEAEPLVPFAWFDDPDWVEPPEAILVPDKRLVEFAFEVPARKANVLWLHVQEFTLGRVADFRPVS